MTDYTQQVLFIMGQGASGSAWHYQITAAREAGFSPIVYDHLASGTSRSPFTFQELVDEARDHLGSARAVVGTSIGARIAATLAAEGHVDTLILGAPHARVTKTQALLSQEQHSVAEIAALNLSPDSTRDPREEQHWLTLIALGQRRVDPQAYVVPSDHVDGFDLREMYAHITAQTTIIEYADDAMIHRWQTQEVADTIPGTHLVRLEHAGHWGYLEQHAGFNRIMLDALRGSTD
ncbi:alpha/beta fold hydrolase [Corynebacterium pyruviciproducens]|uniref:alpha/beta fold hydrolase n=1 Tax=Corynebacterium pyruviciproducens TaxID=598660 RepID=UPI0039837677